MKKQEKWVQKKWNDKYHLHISIRKKYKFTCLMNRESANSWQNDRYSLYWITAN